MLRLARSLLLTVALCWIAVRLLELAPAWLKPAWTPRDLADVDGRADRWLLASVADDRRWCGKILDAAGVDYERVPDRVTGPGCGFAGAVRLTGPGWAPRGPAVTCPLAVALTVWRRRVVALAAGGSGTVIEHFGTYNCRAIAGSARRSEHATANAIDIAGFRLRNGARVSVGRDWEREGATRNAAFLHGVHDGGCALFGTVLGPGYNAAHRDHLHLDMARWRYCP